MKKSYQVLANTSPFILFIILIIFASINKYICTLLFYLWIYIVNKNIYSSMDEQLKSNIDINKLNILFSVGIFLLLINIFRTYVLSFFSTIGFGGLLPILLLSIPLLFIGISLYSLSSKIIMSEEKNMVSNNNILVFIEHLFFPIGILFLQNKIRHLSKQKYK